jgi:hypothetical protein
VKDIKDMNLEEALDYADHILLWDERGDSVDSVKEVILHIRKLTQWNNIDDSLPPKGALFETCGVESGTYWRYYTPPPSPAVDALYVSEDKP